jgi:hypothetical protein
VRIVVAKAQDIDGSPIVGETLCFFAQGGGVSKFTGEYVEDPKELLYRDGGNAYVFGSIVEHPPGQESKFCETTNVHGLAAIEVTNSTLLPVDVNVNYLEEGIIRDHSVLFTEPVVKGSDTSTIATSASTTLIAALPTTLNLGSAVTTVTKPLTRAQKLAAALKACKKKSKSKRAACEAQARKAFQAKTTTKTKTVQAGTKKK